MKINDNQKSVLAPLRSNIQQCLITYQKNRLSVIVDLYRLCTLSVISCASGPDDHEK